jgi:hypothetical protein
VIAPSSGADDNRGSTMSTEVRAARLSEMPSLQTPERQQAAPPFSRIGISAVAAAADQLKRAEEADRAKADAAPHEWPPVVKDALEAL